MLVVFGWLLASCAAIKSQIRVQVASNVSADPTFGRVRVYISDKCDATSPPPRTLCSDNQDTAQVFGTDMSEADDWVTINETTLGYPVASLVDIAGGPYCVQAELFRYVKYVRGDGANVSLPKSCVGDGNDGSYGSPAGTLYSSVVMANFPTELDLVLAYEVPQPSTDLGCSGGVANDWIKTVSVSSKLLEQFWGTSVELSACVLLPYGFDDHPNATYPIVLAHGHYSKVFEPGGRFDPRPPANLTGYDYVDQLYANYLYFNWTAPDAAFRGARMLIATINHPVPFFDDSYAVDSANVGPYGTAIMTELLPEIEARYRGIGAGWSRGLFGGSTGGWEALAMQIFYPDDFNYAAVACPDPISFTSYATINIYSDTSAYYYDAPFKKTPRPGLRDAYSGQTVVPGTSTPTYGRPYGHTTATIEEMCRREVVLGPRSGSCGQWDIWEAVFSPRGDDGYPKRIWCKDPVLCGDQYGKIDPSVAEYWRENYDLLHIMRRDWATLSPSLQGKLHIFVGGSDTFFLNNAVMDVQDWAATLDSPGLEGEIVIGAHDGRGFEHCFNGYLPDGTVAPNAITRELYVTKFVPLMAERFLKTAPPDANLEWSTY